MNKTKRISRFIALLLVCFFICPASSFPFAASAESNISCDQANKTITINDGRLSLTVDYNKKAVIRSLKLDSTELLGTDGICSSMVLDADTSKISSETLENSPSVTLEGNNARIDFTMGNSKLSVNEEWGFTVADKNIALKVTRSYNWAVSTDTRISHSGMLEFNWQRIWDNIRRPDDGGNIPIGNSYVGKNGMYLNVKGERTGLEQGNLVFLDHDKSMALKVSASSDRNIATEFSYKDANQMCTETLLSQNEWGYTAGNKTDGMVIGGHSSTDGTYIYSPVSISKSQTDTVNYSFSADSYSNYYISDQIKGVSDLKAVSSMLEDFGRSAIIDKKYGFSTVGIYQTGHGAYDSPYYLPLLEGLFDQKAVDAEKSQLLYDRDYAQEASGHLNGRTFHRDTKWSNDTLMDSDPAYIISIASVYNYSPDKAWLSQIKASGEKALDYMVKSHLNSNGLFNTGVDNTSMAGLFREWNDIFLIGNESSYINLLMYQALTEWSDLEANVFGNKTLAKRYTQIASALKTQFNKNTEDGGFWSTKNQSFVYWLDKDGSIHGDVVQAQIDLMSIEAGLTPLSRSKTLMGTIDSYMSKNNLKMIPENFIDYDKSEYPDFQGINAFKTGVENGAVYPLFVNDYMAAEAKIGERSKSLTYLENTISLYKKNGFYGFSHLNWDLTIPNGFQEKWFPVNANAASGLYRYILGIQPTRTGITIAPNLPAKMYGTCITKTIRGNQTITVKYLSETSLNVSWDASKLPATVLWSGLIPNGSYTISDNGKKYKLAADTQGTVKYTYHNGSHHSVSIVKTGHNSI